MAFIPADHCVQANLTFTCHGQLCVNTLSFQHDVGSYAESDMLSLGVLLVDWWKDNRSAHTSQNCKLTSIVLTDLTTDSSPSVTVVPAGTDGDGQVLTPSAPNNVALCVSFRTSGRGRSARGRNYVLGIPLENIVGDTVEAIYATDVGTHYNTLRDVVELEGWRHVVISRQHNGVVLAAGNPQPVITCLCVDNVVDSQRRRLAGRGT